MQFPPSAGPLSGPETISLGCRLNIAESETIRALLGRRDAIVVNSCAVTAEAVRRSRREVARARARRPGAPLYVTGCAATIDPVGFAALPGVTKVVANPDKLAPAAWGVEALPAPASFAGHARAFLPVQTGCDHSCTFCIIPAGRGPSRSLPAGGVVEAARALVAAGHREVVLTGVDLTAYGADLPGSPSLGGLVQRLLAHVPGLERLRLSSLDSVEIDGALFECLTGEARVMPHVHLSLQAGDDLILKRMKRRHSRADAVAMVARLKAARPEIAIGADLIAGFPTEDAAMAANTLALVDDCDVVLGHIFPYSPRPGTPAARMPQVDGAAIKARAAALREATARRRAGWLATLVGTRQQVLVERPGNAGHAESFAGVAIRQDGASTSSARTAEGFGSHPPACAEPVEAPSLLLPVGSIRTVRITAATADHLIGTPA